MKATWTTIEPVLDQWIEKHETELSDLVQHLIRFPSISSGLQTDAQFPFGKQCARLADESRQIVEHCGLIWQNHNYYAISATYGSPVRNLHSDNGNSRGRIAFYSHLDVVPAGATGWKSNPFEPYRENGWIFGRGSTDNKGPFSSVLFALRFLSEQNIELNHDVTLFGGFDEEVGMDDAKWIASHLEPSLYNLVSDCAFPVCVAEKGILEIEAVAHIDDESLLSFCAGEAANAVPDSAYASILQNDAEKGAVHYKVSGKSAHAAFPEGSENALVSLARQLADNSILNKKTRDLFSSLADVFSDSSGSKAGIALHDDFLGDTTFVPTIARYENGELHILINLRYPAIKSSIWVLGKIKHTLDTIGLQIESFKDLPARPVHENSSLVRLLTEIVNDELCSDLKPYAMGGATHARWIPDAMGFGPGQNREKSFPVDIGSGHEANEAVCIEHLKQAISIYVRTILELDAKEKI